MFGKMEGVLELTDETDFLAPSTSLIGWRFPLNVTEEFCFSPDNFKGPHKTHVRSTISDGNP